MKPISGICPIKELVDLSVHDVAGRVENKSCYCQMKEVKIEATKYVKSK